MTGNYGKLHELIGEYVTRCGRVEFFLRRSAMWLSNMDMQLVSAFLAHYRTTSSLTNLIERLVKYRSFPAAKSESVQETLKRFRALSQLRNALAHYGANPLDTGEILLMKAPKLSAQIPAVWARISMRDLQDALIDLQTVEYRLLLDLDPALPPEMRAGYELSARGAWRYKPAPHPQD
jgi:hypothetical protein